MASGVLANESPQPSRPPFVAPHQLPCTPRTPRNRYLVPERASTQCCMQSCSAPLLPSPQPHQLAACTRRAAWLNRPYSKSPCRAPFATQWGRQGGRMSPAPHHQPPAKPPAPNHRPQQPNECECTSGDVPTHSFGHRATERRPLLRSNHLKLSPPGGLGASPSKKLPAFEALGPPPA